MRTALRTAFTILFALFSASSVPAEVRTKTIEYEHGGVKLAGFLAWDDAKQQDGTRPGVLVCPEWWGCNEYAHTRAKMLAELGYVAFAIDLYGKDKVTTDPKEAQAWSSALYGDAELLRGRARAGYAVLASQSQVDNLRIAAIGYCMGGTIALELARSGADLRAVVAFHTSKLTSLLDKTAPMKAKVTICHGQDDGFVTAEEIAGFHAEMKAAKTNYQFFCYAGAVHSFTNKGADAFKIPGVAYDAKADARSWEHMQLALAEAFARNVKH